MKRIILVTSLLLVSTPAALRGDTEHPDWGDVGAIFKERCVMCHSSVHGAGLGLRLDSYAAAIAGSSVGPVLVPGYASGSEMIRRIRGESTPRMPFLAPPLPQDEIDLIVRWIDAGLPDVRGPDPN